MVATILGAPIAAVEELEVKTRYSPKWHCPNQRYRTMGRLRTILAPQWPAWERSDAHKASPREYRERLEEQVTVIFGILEVWFQAMENGTACERLPDPNFVVPSGRPPITEFLLQNLIVALDKEMDEDAFGTHGKRLGANAGSEFYRLDPVQQRALTQDLMSVLLSDDEIFWPTGGLSSF